MEQKKSKASVDKDSTSPRIQSLPDSTSAFVRAGTVIGSHLRAIEELVRNSIVHGHCSNVTVTLQNSQDDEPGKRFVVEVKDDGRGLTEEPFRDMIGSRYCSSDGSTSRGQSLKSIADLCVEFHIESTHGVDKKDHYKPERRDRHVAILTAPSKRKRQDTEYESLNQKKQYSHFVKCEKIIRNGEVVKFVSTQMNPENLLSTWSGTGTVVRLYGLFHQHYVRQQQYLRATSQSSTIDDTISFSHIKSCVQILAMAFPWVGLRLCTTSPRIGNLSIIREQSIWLKPSLEGKNKKVSDATMIRFRQLLCDRVNDKTVSVFNVDYEENHDGSNESSYTEDDSRTRWKVNGVLCLNSQFDDAPDVIKERTVRSRLFELIYSNQRILKNSTSIADMLQKLCAQLYGSRTANQWLFLLHISCPCNDVDIIVDDTKSYSCIRQRDRLYNLMIAAMTKTFKDSSNSHGQELSTISSHLIGSKIDVTRQPLPGESRMYSSSRIISGVKSNQPSFKCESSRCSSPFTDAFFKSKDSPKIQHLIPSIKNEVSLMLWTRNRLKSLEDDVKTISALHKGKEFHELKISKDMLSRCQLIGQVDMKYILVDMDGIICAIDQHAADERIGLERLERLLSSIIDESERRGSDSIKLSKMNKSIHYENLLKTIPLKEAHRLSLSPNQLSVVLDCKQVLCKWRFDFDVDLLNRSLTLKAVPGLCDKAATPKDFTQFIQALESRVSDAIYCKPAFVNRILASYACRYAIMFGDELDNNRCSEIVQELSGCDLSFICAHGRPSAVPIVDLNMLQKEESSVQNLDQSLPLRFRISRINAYEEV